jgi:hypothetical protein
VTLFLKDLLMAYISMVLLMVCTVFINSHKGKLKTQNKK